MVGTGHYYNYKCNQEAGKRHDLNLNTSSGLRDFNINGHVFGLVFDEYEFNNEMNNVVEIYFHDNVLVIIQVVPRVVGMKGNDWKQRYVHDHVK